jgi:hypothetical protein
MTRRGYEQCLLILALVELLIKSKSRLEAMSSAMLGTHRVGLRNMQHLPNYMFKAPHPNYANNGRLGGHATSSNASSPRLYSLQ